MGKKDEPYLIETEQLFMQDRSGRKRYEKRLREGWELVGQTEVSRTLLRSSVTMTWRRPNPKFKGA